MPVAASATGTVSRFAVRPVQEQRGLDAGPAGKHAPPTGAYQQGSRSGVSLPPEIPFGKLADSDMGALQQPHFGSVTVATSPGRS
jgi:hypothetical protein